MALSVSGWVTDGDGDLSHILIFALKPFCILLLPPDDDDDSGDDDNDDHLLFSRPHMAQGRIPRCTQALAERNWTFWEKHWICFFLAFSSISLVCLTNKPSLFRKTFWEKKLPKAAPSAPQRCRPQKDRAISREGLETLKLSEILKY